MPLAKSRTMAVDKEEVDFRVHDYSCVDSSIAQTLGKHCKLTKWTVGIGDLKPFDVTLHVDKSITGKVEVGVACDNQQVFPAMLDEHGRPSDKAPLRKDFEWTRAFRGTVAGLGKDKYFEVQAKKRVWHPATLKQQKDGSYFCADVYVPHESGKARVVHYPMLHKDDIRIASNGKALVIPQRQLALVVPVEDPLKATLTVEQQDLTHFFCRRTPPPPPPNSRPTKSPRIRLSKIDFFVSKARDAVTAKVSYATLKHFLSGEPRQVRCLPAKMTQTWVLRLGPFAEHNIELTRHSRVGGLGASKVFRLMVDGELLVQAAKEDLPGNSDENVWQCSFRLAGRRFLDWHIYECDSEGKSLDIKTTVSQKGPPFSHDLNVRFELNEPSLQAATLTVDDVDFHKLAELKEHTDRSMISCTPESMEACYGLRTPWKICDNPPQAHIVVVQEAVKGFFCNPMEWLQKCCGSTPPPPAEPVAGAGDPAAAAPPPTARPRVKSPR